MKKIIVVDDSRTLRIQVRTKLEEEGFDVLEAEDGMLGYELVKENQDCKLILSDVNMQGMDGISMLEKLNKTSSFRNFCFVIVGPEGERHSIEKLLVKKKLPLIDLVGKINLAEIFLLMRESQLFIGNDSVFVSKETF